MTALRGFAVHHACKRGKTKLLTEELPFSDFRINSLAVMKYRIILLHLLNY